MEVSNTSYLIRLKHSNKDSPSYWCCTPDELELMYQNFPYVPGENNLELDLTTRNLEDSIILGEIIVYENKNCSEIELLTEEEKSNILYQRDRKLFKDPDTEPSFNEDVSELDTNSIENQIEILTNRIKEIESEFNKYKLRPSFGLKRKVMQFSEDVPHKKYLLELIEEHSLLSKNILSLKMRQKEQETAIVYCDDCKDIINSGTSGNIFSDKTNDNLIIKGSKVTDFSGLLHEHSMWKQIKSVFPKENNIITLVNLSNPFEQNSHIYFKMNRIKPIILTDEQNIKLNQRKELFSELEFEILKKSENIFMLTPGIKNKKHFSSGGNEHSSWFELGENIIKLYFDILDIDYNIYLKSLNLILENCYTNNIALRDVEFILGSVNDKQGIYMIDFDKTFIIEESNHIPIKILTEEDMWPDEVRQLYR